MQVRKNHKILTKSYTWNSDRNKKEKPLPLQYFWLLIVYWSNTKSDGMINKKIISNRLLVYSQSVQFWLLALFPWHDKGHESKGYRYDTMRISTY